MYNIPDFTPLFWFACAAIFAAIAAVISAPLVYFSVMPGTTAFLLTVIAGVGGAVTGFIFFR